MQDIDRMIEEALNDEEKALFRETATEPGFFGQTLGVFGGRAGWVNAVLMVAQTAAFFCGAWAAWRFFQADNALSALHWGLPAAVLVLASLVMKMALVPVMHANRVLRELKRLELQLAISRKG